MRSRLQPLLPLLLAWLIVVLAGCAGGPRTVEVSRQQLQSALERRFPHEERPAGLLAFRVGLPQLELLPQANRVRLDFPLEASDRIVRNTFRGELGVSFGLRYEPSDASVRATSVRVERFSLPDLPAALRAPLQGAGGAFAENLLEDTVLHTFRPEDLARARGWTPGAIRVTPGGLRVEFLPPA
ncbi:DUF1439 domain-containing protein [Ramlibacter sp. AN1133]|uniref:DUF1439 domain-containing protein n=1 Tax=Ramlibacter sp. AN1133 TaxID=3133429 RepID=UPI0030BD86BC